ncbi:PqqD family protein [Roseospira marina]|nr:PqqD family protein [Roseospira marina]
MWRWDGEDGAHVLIGVPLTRSAHMLNPVAARIFGLCDGETPVAAMIDRLRAAYPNAAPRIAGDVRGFLGYLRDLEVIDGWPG